LLARGLHLRPRRLLRRHDSRTITLPAISHVLWRSREFDSKLLEDMRLLIGLAVINLLPALSAS